MPRAPVTRSVPEWTPYEDRPAPDLSYDESGLEPWRRAYADFLRKLCAGEAPERIAAGCVEAYDSPGDASNRYTLYDVDKDGLPELFIRFGNCEAAYHTRVYAFRDGAVEELGDMGASHSALHTWPGENAVLQSWGHMGYGGMSKYTISNGELVSLGDFFTENINTPESAGYTAPSKLVPGSAYLDEWWTVTALPEWTAMTLPIYAYGAADPPPQVSAEEEAAAEDAILAVLYGGGPLYGVSGDGFGGDTGWTDFAGYCAPGAVIDYSVLPTPPKRLAWADLNGDGQKECLLFLEEAGELPEDRGWRSSAHAVLSFQDGVVYAYCINYLDDYVLHQDGVFYNEARASSYTLSFWKNQCFLTYAYDQAPAGPPAAWESAS